MKIKKNPFTSEIYNRIWAEQYNKTSLYNFDFIKNVKFNKHKIFPLYYNVGKYKSCGISYNLIESDLVKDYKKKVFLIYDIPKYFKVNTSYISGLSTNKIPQYDGYLIDLSKYKTIDQYLYEKFKSKSRYSLKNRIKKLERDHSIQYEWHHGYISKDTYNALFNKMYFFIESSFTKEENSHTTKEIRKWYYYLFYEMINNKTASFFCIKNADVPIAVFYSYHSDKILFGAIPSTDKKYSKYGLGSIGVIKSIEWAINNKYSILDLSKGSYGYKHRWATRKYNFEYHIFYDKKYLPSLFIGKILTSYFKIKQYLRKIKHQLKKQ